MKSKTKKRITVKPPEKYKGIYCPEHGRHQFDLSFEDTGFEYIICLKCLYALQPVTPHRVT